VYSLLLIGGVVMGGSVVFSIIGERGSHVRKVSNESMLPLEPQSVADMLREAEENLGERQGSAFPTPAENQNNDEPTSDDEESLEGEDKQKN
jgi:hypothetical protein